MKFTMFLFAFLTFATCEKTSSKSNQGCGIFLKPILSFGLYAGEDKMNILNNLDQSIQLDGDDLKYTPKDIDLFNGTKKITLPNGYNSNAEFSLRFRGKKLVGYRIFLEIGENYNYGHELLGLIKQHDENEINAFIYNSDKKPSYTDFNNDSDCKRFVSIQRDKDNPKLFMIEFASN